MAVVGAIGGDDRVRDGVTWTDLGPVELGLEGKHGGKGQEKACLRCQLSHRKGGVAVGREGDAHVGNTVGTR